MRESLPRFDHRLDLGRRLRVSPFCIGIVDTPEVVSAAFDAGINFFFVTADMHWPLYEPLRRGLEQLLARGDGIRDRVVVAGVSYATQPEFCSDPFNELLASVPGLERLDVLIAGGAYGYELERRLPIYQAHRERAHCGALAIGASFHDRAAAIAHACTGALDLCLVRYNAAHAGAREDLFPYVHDRRALLYNFTSLRGYVHPKRCDELGLQPEMWLPSITDHYRFVLSRPELDGILCSPSTPEHLASLIAALAHGPLDEDEQAHLVLLSRLNTGHGELVRGDPRR